MICLHKELCMDVAGYREREGKQEQKGFWGDRPTLICLTSLYSSSIQVKSSWGLQANTAGANLGEWREIRGLDRAHRACL